MTVWFLDPFLSPAIPTTYISIPPYLLRSCTPVHVLFKSATWIYIGLFASHSVSSPPEGLGLGAFNVRNWAKKRHVFGDESWNTLKVYDIV